MRIRSKVAGVTATNEDGLKRQEIIRRGLKPGMHLVAVREPENPHDDNAIALYVRGKAHRWKVGYLKAGLAEELAGHLDDGADLAVRVLQVTGGGPGKSYGVNIQIDVEGAEEFDDDDEDEDEQPRRRGRRGIVTTQATGKGWKGLQALGCLGTLVAIVLFVAGVSMVARDGRESSAELGAVAILMFVVALPTYLVGRVGAWWNHG